MPRGKRTIVSVEDRIQSTCAEIESLQERIRSKKEELKNLKAEKEKSDAARIIAAVQESGKSVDEVLTLLSHRNILKNKSLLIQRGGNFFVGFAD